MENRKSSASQSEDKLELGLDSLCYNRQIAGGHFTLADVMQECHELGGKWVRLHSNHLSTRASADELLEINDLSRRLDLSIVWSGDSIGRASDGVTAGTTAALEQISKAVEVGARIVQFYPSWYRYEAEMGAQGIDAEVEYLVTVLSSLVETITDSPLVLALENHSNLNSFEMVDIVRRVGAPEQVGIYMDVANPFAVSEDVVAAVERLAPYTFAIDVKDLSVVSNWASREWHRLGYSVNFGWPGDGILPWKSIWPILCAKTPNGALPVVIEGLDESRDPSESARKAIEFLRELPGCKLSVHQ